MQREGGTWVVRHVMVPTDFSEASRAAVDLAVDYARRLGARMTLFHAHEMPAYFFPDAMMPVSPEALVELERSVRAELERLAAPPRAAGIEVTTASSIGVHDLEICRYAEEHGVDLIVMGTHGRTGFRRAILGSVAERVVRRAPCPVLTVRPGSGPQPEAPAP